MHRQISQVTSKRTSTAVLYGLSIGFAVVASGCGNGSGSDQTQFTLSLESDAPCYGVRAEIDLTALAKAVGTCELSEEVTASGCSADISTQDDVLVADARGCMIDAGTTLFDCRLGSKNAAAVEAATTVTYGCGCQSTCPSDVSLAVQTASSASESASADSSGLSTRTRAVSVETAVVSTTTSTFCGTCCDYYENPTVSMAAAARVTEIAFVLSLDGGRGRDQCEFSADECQIAVAASGPSYIREVGRTLEVCISDPTGIDAGATLMSCELIAPSYGDPPLTVLRADGEQLEPLDPLPMLTLNDDY